MDDDVGCAWLMPLGVFVWAIWPGSGDHWNDNLWWSVKYGVPYGQVRMNSKPADCNFLQAPLGIKGCSFAPRVTAYNAAGVVVGGDNSPKYGHDTKTGRPIVSLDNGRTWERYDYPMPDLTTKTVEVRWTKVMD
jgi:hypothetical protein